MNKLGTWDIILQYLHLYICPVSFRDVAKESSRDQGQGMTRSGMNKFNINQNRPDLGQ